MKVIQVCARFFPFYGGIETHVREVSKHLKRLGVEVIVFTTDPTGKLPPREVVEGVEVQRFRSFAPYAAYYLSPAMYFKLKDLTDVDVVHAHHYNALPALLAALAKRRNHIPLIITTHYHPFGGTSFRTALWKLYKPLGETEIKNADRIIALNNNERNLLLSTFKIQPSKIQVIPNGVSDTTEGPQRTGIEKGILFVGRLEKYKGVHHVLSIFPSIKKIIPEAQLVIVGDGPYRKELLSTAQRMHISGVQFLGTISDLKLASYYKSAKLFVLLSEYEAFPVSLMEAMAHGCPVVATNVGGIPEVIKDGINGFLVDYPPDEDKLFNLIVYLLQHEEFTEKIGRNGRLSMLSYYSWSQIALKILSLYESIV